MVAGETSEIELTLQRVIDLPSLDWYSGDNHIHMNYGGLFEATPSTLMLETEAEDLNVINDLIANQSGTRIHDLKYFEGELHVLSKPNRLLYYNEEYRPSFSGHMSLLNLKKFFFPQFDGMVGTALSAHSPSNSHVLDAVHSQGGVGGYVHPFYGEPSLRQYGDAREFPVSAALGNADYIDVMCIWSDELHTQKVWYRNLNLGLGVPASAGSDAMTDYWRHPSVGSVRVYVNTGSPLDYGNWIRGLAEGHSFVTNAPLLFLRVEGREPGDQLRLPGGRATSVRVQAEATSILRMDTLTIVQNGEVVHVAALEDPHHVEVDITLPIERSGWIAAKVTGPGEQRFLMDSFVYAHTNPIYIDKGGEPQTSPEDAQYFLTWIDTVMGMLEISDRFDTEEQKREVLEVWQRARDVYAALAEETATADLGRPASPVDAPPTWLALRRGRGRRGGRSRGLWCRASILPYQTRLDDARQPGGAAAADVSSTARFPGRFHRTSGRSGRRKGVRRFPVCPLPKLRTCRDSITGRLRVGGARSCHLFRLPSGRSAPQCTACRAGRTLRVRAGRVLAHARPPLPASERMVASPRPRPPIRRLRQ